MKLGSDSSDQNGSVQEPSSILIVKLSSLGDLIHSLPFVAALRERFPRARIVWAVQPQFLPFIPGFPWIDRVIPVSRPSMRHPLKSFRSLKQLRRELRSESFDLVVDLQGLFKSALVVLLSGAKRRVGTAFMREGSSWISPRVCGEHAQGHAVDRSLDVARFLGASVTTVQFPLPDFTEAKRSLTAKLPLNPSPYILFVPGTRWKTKCWDPEGFATLASRFAADGYTVILAGGKGDRTLAEEILSFVPEHFAEKVLSLVGETTLPELIALIQGAALYVSGDTGPLHIAVATQTPYVALFGPTRPERTGPYPTGKGVILVSPVPCAGCLKRTCSDGDCMKKILPEEVYRRGKGLLANRK